MTTTLRRVRHTATDEGPWPVHYWILYGPDGAIIFSASPQDHPTGLEHGWIDGTPWFAWGITSHVPATRHRDQRWHEHEAEPCRLLEGMPCCGFQSVTQGRETFAAWVHSDRDDEVIWEALAERYPTWVAGEVVAP